MHFSHFAPAARVKLGKFPSDELLEVFSCRISPDASLIAAGTRSGDMYIVDSQLGATQNHFKDEVMRYPVTAFSWKPRPRGEQVLLGACCDGSIIRWSTLAPRSIEHIMLNPDNQYHAVDYSADGRHFVTAGLPYNLEIYDEETMKPFMTIGSAAVVCHTNKIFTCRFNPVYAHLLYSGGWDQQVKFWDIR